MGSGRIIGKIYILHKGGISHTFNHTRSGLRDNGYPFAISFAVDGVQPIGALGELLIEISPNDQ
jgi:hypothetical protein